VTRLIVGVLLVALLVGVLAADQVLVRRLSRQGLYRRDADTCDPNCHPDAAATEQPADDN
jgi:hypothetical protein